MITFLILKEHSPSQCSNEDRCSGDGVFGMEDELSNKVAGMSQHSVIKKPKQNSRHEILYTQCKVATR